MRREFAVTAPDLRFVLLAPGISLLIGMIGIGFAAREERWVWLAAIVIVLAAALIVVSVRRRRVALEGDALTIAAGINTLRVPVAALDVAGARIADLTSIATPRLGRTGIGASMPGYRTGYVRLRDGSHAFVLLTDKTRVLALPERSGRMLLLSLERPQALIDALQAMAQSGARR